MDENELRQAQYEAAQRVHGEAAWLDMLADADERAPQRAAIARQDRAVARELEMEAEYLQTLAAEHSTR